jgi:hypothetical protein
MDDFKMDTAACDLRYQIVQKFKEAGFHIKFNDAACGLLDSNSKIVPWTELIKAKDGCEIHRMLGWDHVCTCPEYNQRFLLVNENTEDPLADTYYEIKSKSGDIVTGKTDDEGYTVKIQSHEEEEFEITVFAQEQ